MKKATTVRITLDEHAIVELLRPITALLQDHHLPTVQVFRAYHPPQGAPEPAYVEVTWELTSPEEES